MLTVSIHDLGEAAVLRCIGRIVVGEEANILRKAVLLHATKRTMVLDLARVNAIDGAGLGLVAFLEEWARASGIDLKLLNPTQRVRELLELTNLNSMLEIVSSEDTALVAGEQPTTQAAYQCD